jgi:DNA-binding NarL/FixJ family response regulator
VPGFGGSISHRTVASHLYRMFPKLGITSRGQLGRVLPDQAREAADVLLERSN